MNSSMTTSCVTLLNKTVTYTEFGLSDPGNISRFPGLVFICILFVFGTFGNVHAIILNIQRFREQKSSRNRKDPYVTFILSLAMIDMLICVFVLPTDFVDNFLRFTLLPEGVCSAYRFFQYSLHIGSVLHVVLICIHCWRRVCFPDKRQIERRLAIRLCIGCNIVGFIASLPSFAMFGYSTITIDGEKGPICFTDDAYIDSMWLKICMGYLAVGFIISLIIIFVSYVALLQSHFTNRPNNRTTRGRSANDGKESGKTTTTLIILTLVFIVSYIPFIVLGSLAVINKHFRQGWNVAMLATYKMFLLFPYLNNVLNPVVYGCMDKDFRKRLKQLYEPLVQKISCTKANEGQIEMSL